MIDIGRLKIFSAILFSGVFTACSDKDSVTMIICASRKLNQKWWIQKFFIKRL